MKAQVNGLKSELGTMGVAIGSVIGNAVTAAISAAAAAISSFVSEGVKQMVELQDTTQAVGVIFGDSASIIMGAADDMALKLGIVKSEFVGAASAFGGMFKGAGMAQADAAALGVTLTKLALDLKSFKGGATTTQDAIIALTSVFKGEFDPIEKFNLSLKAADITQHALAMGLKATEKELTDLDRKMATLDLIMKKTTDQQGDMARTADQMGNSWTNLTGTLTNLKESMAEAFGPALTALLGDAVIAARALRIAWEDNEKAVAANVETTVKGTAESGGAIGMLVMAVGKVGNAWRVIEIAVKMVQTGILQMVGTVVSSVSKIVDLLSNNAIFREVFADTGTSDFLKAYSEDLKRMTLEGEKQVGRLRNAPWPTEQIEKYFTKAREEARALKEEMLMEGFEAEWEKLFAPKELKVKVSLYNESMLDESMTKEWEKLFVKPKEEKAKEFRSETIGSADFASKLRESIFSAKDATGAKALAAAERTAKAAEETAAQLKKGLPAILT